MPTPILTLLADEVGLRLAAARPDATLERSRRTDPGADEAMPILIYTTPVSLAVATEFQVPCESVWTADITVRGWADGGDELAAEAAVSQLANDVVEALVDEPLERPGGGDLTTGLELVGLSAALFQADESSRHCGSLEAVFRATVFAPAGRTSL
ncbi:hypothetical protein [Falsiroseomonas tokyonensis]|uniref:DUF3168 domain-containing protein n=1 Tax=Falsiroseomonas tokyonensis TaxID=430521 RepID=A0ABV7C3F5_9PROT|nr:hypothetical protein [Falsiroseomonas tokyonensis]MBU8540818.1 hypothetical protein [Falsiroseomonas tokyonensis]